MSSPSQFALDHLQWPFIVFAAWWVRGQVQKVLSRADSIYLQLSNHIPTELAEHSKTLQEINQGIKILVDRGR
jgi:hypothetical protein